VLACPAAVLAGWGAGRASRGRAAVVDPAAAAFVLDLVGSALRAGAPAEWAIEGAATAIQRYGTSQLRCAVTPFATTGRLLRLGSDPVHAWTALGETPGLADVAAAGRRCAGSGAALADAFTDVAGQLRAQHRQRELARAARTGMWALLPLGCCFLPAFVCIGVVPVVLGVAGQVLPP
jgi:pilus assembly protein TadC